MAPDISKDRVGKQPAPVQAIGALTEASDAAEDGAGSANSRGGYVEPFWVMDSVCPQNSLGKLWPDRL